MIFSCSIGQIDKTLTCTNPADWSVPGYNGNKRVLNSLQITSVF